ncbi:hypothetical protein [Hoylesella nanceiensis]|uniref:hypothetical protein n=1 Tax=Hoylesella nanceiensis TaxID=425941 RepID=UPI002150C1D0|nr:hypothetical protein [Hoylesella nanceiensis]
MWHPDEKQYLEGYGSYPPPYVSSAMLGYARQPLPTPLATSSVGFVPILRWEERGIG